MQAKPKTIGRNDPCPCGSGKKYKQCCLPKEGMSAAAQPLRAPDSATLQQLLQTATAHHQAGRLQEAEALYRQVLQQQPDQPDALHLLGLIAHQVGQHQQAAELMAQAIRTRPGALMYYNLSMVLEALGRRDEAIECLRQAIVLKPDYLDAWINLGTVCKDQGRLDEAVESYRKALALKPDYAEVHYNLALALQEQNQPDAAIAHYRKALALKPGLTKAYLNLGGLLKEQGNRAEAVEIYRQVLALQPNYVEAHYNLGIALQGQDRLDEEIAQYRRVLELKPEHAGAHNNLGNALKAQDKPDEAAAHYLQALAFRPDYAEAHFNLGIVLQEQGKVKEAIELYLKALALKPDYAAVHYNLSGAFQSLGKLEQANHHCREYIAFKPEDAEAHCNLAGVLRSQGYLDEAIANCKQAMALQPDYARAYSVLGSIHVDLGQFDLAQAVLFRALEIDPDNRRAWSLLPMLRKMTPEDADWVKKALEMLPTGGSEALSDEVIALRFAIGKYYDDTRQYDAAFAAYSEGNAIKYQRQGWSGREKHTRLVDVLRSVYTADFVRQPREGASASERPVLIVGMPRSGTSLTEQIIASHPATFGAGELPFWLTRPDEYQRAELSGQYDKAFLAGAAAEYEQLLQKYSPTASRIVDKMPGNFWKLGLITTVFPHARIIHTQRNPVDTCLSIYFQNFNATHPYASNLDDLAFYYREYLRIMAHWRSVLPPERFLDVPYEALTADQEGWSRRIIGFLGLEWDERCLEFHKTERKVGTASNWQVRQKIYQTSKERWRNYEQHLKPLLGLLEIEA